MSIHVVQPGDSLWSIANLYQTSMNAIIEINGLEDVEQIVPGLALYIQDDYIPPRHYQIKEGDSLWQVAKTFDTNINELIVLNPGIRQSNLLISQIINVPSSNPLPMETLGFLFPMSKENAEALLNGIAECLTYIAIVAYTFTEEGTVVIESADDTELVPIIKRFNIKPLLMIRNFSGGEFDAELAGSVLENESRRSQLVQSLVEQVTEKGYGGVSIDFEFIPPNRRLDFIIFLEALKRQLGDHLLHVNVHAKSEENITNRITGGYDYAAIGRVADIVAVMTIDYGYPTGPPDPVSPIWWMEGVIRYAVSLINPKKLQMALPLYGYDWRVSDQKTQAYSNLAAQNLAIVEGSTINYDFEAAAPWYPYWNGDEEHLVWFDDIRSFQRKYELLDAYQLLGTTFWHIRLPFPQNWQYMRDYFTIKKK
ncbi:glycosyl hydrolase family 18 protein [Cytobacillus purgationiresistens]|uniref:Spore germination protein n=1 Tax=Cytobacillus purgationiresistens TaxID=863449 RepID=A0ABU0ABN6_9BACI|nr:glycosyl hydrolase family 18 protein [Cytobacillus purgationiresistens]MDQ0268455.1 spore germination protein [Cytobacillus purgationiresistens]